MRLVNWYVNEHVNHENHNKNRIEKKKKKDNNTFSFASLVWIAAGKLTDKFQYILILILSSSSYNYSHDLRNMDFPAIFSSGSYFCKEAGKNSYN